MHFLDVCFPGEQPAFYYLDANYDANVCASVKESASLEKVGNPGPFYEGHECLGPVLANVKFLEINEQHCKC